MLSRRRLTAGTGMLTLGCLVANSVFIWLIAEKGELDANVRSDIALTPVVLMLTSMGILVLRKHPGHLIGYAMCLTGLMGR